MLVGKMEPSLSWRKICCISAIIVASLFLFNVINSSKHTRVGNLRNSISRVRPVALQRPLDFDIEHSDALSEQQCTDLFPDLYQEVNRAVAYWKERKHTITPEDVEILWRKPKEKGAGGGAMRILIHENGLRILESLGVMNHLGYRGRAIGALNLLQRAVDSASAGGEKLPDIEVALVFQDNSDPPIDKDDTHSFWSYAASKDNESHKRIWLMPNFDFWYAFPMGSYSDARRRAFQYDAAFSKKIPRVVWRGSGWVNQDVRGALVNETQEKDWADVKIVDWGGNDDIDGMAIEEMCKYAFMAHTEGIAYSGRLKYLLNCDSVPIVHKLHWNTYYTHLLIPDGPEQNFISVERNWTDLESNVKYYLNHPKEAEKIVQNSMSTFRRRYMTRAAQSCYFRKLIKGYSTVSFKPQTVQKSEKGVALRRGFSFERFMDSPQDMVYENEMS